MLMRDPAVVPISDMTGYRLRRNLEEARPGLRHPRLLGIPDVSAAEATKPCPRRRLRRLFRPAGVTRLPDISDVPYLDVVAALNQDGRRLTLFCVNRSLNTDIPANIRVDHFDPRRAA